MPPDEKAASQILSLLCAMVDTCERQARIGKRMLNVLDAVVLNGVRPPLGDVQGLLDEARREFGETP